LLAGGVSDDVGRRPVLLAALGALMASSVLFMVAGSAAWLFVARGVQGLATGAALSAAMLDLHPRRDATSVALGNGVASAGGLGLGMLVSSSLVQLAPAPLLLPYLVLLALFATAFAGAFLMPESVMARTRLRLTPQRPSVPAVVRRPFILASLAVFSSWSIGGLFFSLGPQLSTHLFRSSSVIVAGVGIVALTCAAAIAQLFLGRGAPWIGASAGSIALAAGMIGIVTAAAVRSGPAFLAGAVVGGVGFGLSFLGGLRALVAAIPSEQRAAVMSAFYLAAYSSLSLPAVLAGVVVAHV